ncbi:putative ABC transport system permease protein [Pseudobutyrivibrio sp. YE44]|uniref:ABC transporter permease n=1 Tax=Pseudobutyrivibrio sp. YE44 TaxID=1520802 RepID=UPI0008839905|nr:ABC transporter permease [Pseudobutyrivibrio sp. YE44]SDB15119.1 putative ABC transport system permease protein [Pseudobutyrivibrio sp. YE44]
MRNPLRKRIFRELLADWKKYIALFAIMVITIGFVSGMFVANDSMNTAGEEAYDKYNVEDGHFELKEEATDKLLDAIEDEGVVTYKQFYKQVSERIPDKKDAEKSKVRVFVMRDKVNGTCLMEGEYPKAKDEIAIDRMHADNVGIKIGDFIRVDGYNMKVTGFVALSDYSTLYEDNSEIMFNAITFDVAVVTQEGFDSIKGATVYQYAFTYDKEPKDTEQQKKKSDDFVEELYKLAATGGDVDNPNFEHLNEVTGYLPEYLNQATHFAQEDIGKDKVMGEVLLIVLIGVIAFIFAIAISNTILNEASVIGTLRASGYRKGELLRHYVTVPILVTLLAAVVGNILGYTFFKNVVVTMYYNSYSLPTYETLWNSDAFVKTTVYPVLLVIAINFLVISSKLQFSPLQFLRRDLSKSKRQKAVRLPKWSFLNRFRLRVLMQNVTGYFTLFLGIFLVLVLLNFAVGLPATLENYKSHASEFMITDYQYILKKTVDNDGNEISTGEKGAEKYSSRVLLTIDGVHVDEEITAYGYNKNSKYIALPDEANKNDIWVSESFAEKFSLEEGQKITLKEHYTSDTYDFTIKGIYNQPGIMAIFMPNENFNDIFDYDDDHFTGYLSTEEITDIDDEYILSVVTQEDILKMVKQLDHSMGAYMDYFGYGCMALAVLLILLLTKIIIEKNTVSISMLKVLGYTNGEVNSVFIRLTTIMVIIFAIISTKLSDIVLNTMWETIMYGLNGWFTFYASPKDYVKMVVMVIVAYLIVVLLDMRRIKRIPLTEALKNVE